VNTTTITSEEFQKDPNGARKATANGPVFISERGVHAFALITIEEYRRIGGKGESILDLLAMPEDEYFDWEPPRMELHILPADFS